MVKLYTMPDFFCYIPVLFKEKMEKYAASLVNKWCVRQQKMPERLENKGDMDIYEIRHRRPAQCRQEYTF